jgi:hypothetical protein
MKSMKNGITQVDIMYLNLVNYGWLDEELGKKGLKK